ncbi:hypothetical protein HEB94_002085 [Actinopolymorpha pittospori]|uniref:Uncharacterized protein n=1 Tax=Actinopolymorpha pittospori TaxID=648752 RepID=A0A927R768_9ACTN|nr:hypothetical protein [Actinopolymorpha pittospori]
MLPTTLRRRARLRRAAALTAARRASTPGAAGTDVLVPASTGSTVRPRTHGVPAAGGRGRTPR